MILVIYQSFVIFFIWTIAIQNNSKGPASRASSPHGLIEKQWSIKKLLAYFIKTVQNEGWKIILKYEMSILPPFFIFMCLYLNFSPICK